MNNELDKYSEEIQQTDNYLVIAKSKELSNEYKQGLKTILMEFSKDQRLLNNDEVTKQVLEEWDINVIELFKEGIMINESHPTISKQNLAIELLSKVASNKKNKKMSKIAEEMLNERWWEK